MSSTGDQLIISRVQLKLAGLDVINPPAEPLLNFESTIIATAMPGGFVECEWRGQSVLARATREWLESHFIDSNIVVGSHLDFASFVATVVAYHPPTDVFWLKVEFIF